LRHGIISLKEARENTSVFKKYLKDYYINLHKIKLVQSSIMLDEG